MSGPTTVIFTADPATVLLAAAAIRAAEAVQAGYREASRLTEEHTASRDEQHAAQAAANAAGQEKLAAAARRAEQRHAQLCQLAEPYGLAAALRTLQAQAPADASQQALAAYIEQLAAQNRTLESALRDLLGEPAALDEAGIDLSDLPAAAATPVTPASPTDAARLLARLAALGPLPEAIEALSRELATTTNADRAELLGIELRGALQRFEEQAAQEASALVLEQTLKDLGYQVEPVSDTLFVDGGIVHFRRAGWGDYQVRLRLDATASRANFNVVRAVDAGNNERSVLDHIAEDRWCAEFPALLAALAKRGLHLEVTRRLAAGELPVQLVDRAQLPRFADEESAPTASAPLMKEIR